MIDFLRNLFAGKRSSDSTGNDFSDFFIHAKSKEKAKVIREVLREANEEQREMVEKYGKEARTA